jgi:F-type H+-transporting ATPase subunit alpha
LIIFAGTTGALDDLPIEQVRDFEAELYRYVDTTNPGLLRSIMEKKTLDDALKAEMTKLVKECKEAFVAERQAVAAAR